MFCYLENKTKSVLKQKLQKGKQKTITSHSHISFPKKKKNKTEEFKQLLSALYHFFAVTT